MTDGVRMVVIEQNDSPDHKSIFMVTVLKEGYENCPVTTVAEGKLFAPKRSRCWGWYSTFEWAEKAILTNATDIFEVEYYNLAVIEELSEGLCQIAHAKQWYRADYEHMRTPHDPTVNKIDPPIGIKSCNFCIG